MFIWVVLVNNNKNTYAVCKSVSFQFIRVGINLFFSKINVCLIYKKKKQQYHIIITYNVL